MRGQFPFIASYQLESISPVTIPFLMEELSPHSEREHEHELMQAHRHTYYMIGLCLEGESRHMLDFEHITMRAGEMLLVAPGQIHQPLDVNCSGHLLAFTADFLLAQHVTLPQAVKGPIRLPEADLQQVLLIFAQIHQEYIGQAPQYPAMLQHYLALLITLFQRHATTTTPTGHPLLVRYRELLATHFTEWTKPAQYASAMHLSPDHLNEVIKQHTGQTLSAHITERRILEAKRLLLHTQESIKEIAWHLQFNEVSYFNRFFKQHTGYTPAVFRETAREKYPSIPE